MSKSKVVDLEMSSDGTYASKHDKKLVTKDTKKAAKNLDKKPKYLLSNEVDEFLGGIDSGLNLLDEIVPRVGRFFRLRG